MKNNLTRLFFIFFVLCNTGLSAQPRVSVITSLFCADEFIEGFLQDIVRQTIFNECEFIIINAHSPGHEEVIIKKYTDRYSNIIYVKLDNDPGLYSVWNRAIKIASSNFITNANVDDRRNPASLEMQVCALENCPEVDLVYMSYYVTKVANEPFESNTRFVISEQPEFTVRGMQFSLPGPQPMWRKSLHEKYGYFDETFFIEGDHEMWLRAVSKGAIFKKIEGYSGVFYLNSRGLSSQFNTAKTAIRLHDAQRIQDRYSYLWK